MVGTEVEAAADELTAGWQAICWRCVTAGHKPCVWPVRPTYMAAWRDKVLHDLPGACETSRVESAAQRERVS